MAHDKKAVRLRKVQRWKPRTFYINNSEKTDQDLLGELTGRRQDEDERPVSGFELRLMVSVDEGRQEVAEGLSRSGLSNGDQIHPGKSDRPALKQYFRYQDEANLS